MTPRRKELELTIERELPVGRDGAPRRARLTARFPSDSSEEAPTPEELGETLRSLVEQLERAAGPVSGVAPLAEGARRERELQELLDTYRPRQVELVELLHADGSVTDREAELLHGFLASERPKQRTPASQPGGRSLPPSSTPPSGATPAAGSVLRSPTRSVEELLRTYQIISLRQAGAVRARRQISFDEYMALKRHFASEELMPGGEPRSTPERKSPPSES